MQRPGYAVDGHGGLRGGRGCRFNACQTDKSADRSFDQRSAVCVTSAAERAMRLVSWMMPEQYCAEPFTHEIRIEWLSLGNRSGQGQQL